MQQTPIQFLFVLGKQDKKNDRPSIYVARVHSISINFDAFHDEAVNIKTEEDIRLNNSYSNRR